MPLEHFPDAQVEKTMRVDLEPIDPPVVFFPPTASGLRFRGRGTLGNTPPVSAIHGPEGELRYQPVDNRGLKYDVFLSRTHAQTFRHLSLSDRPRYLVVPSDTPPRIRTLAESWTRGAASANEKARLIEWHLRTEYRYDLASSSGRARYPLDNFLFESKRGHCEFYSTAMAILLRMVGVPSRNVMGFVGGTYNRFGRFYSVRQGDAHSWVEAYIEDAGWVTFDPTPPGDAAPKSEFLGVWASLRDLVEATSQRWERHVVGYDLNQQVNLLQMLTRSRSGSVLSRRIRFPSWRIVAAIVGLLGVVAYVAVRRRAGPQVNATTEEQPRSVSSLLATELYERLDTAMGASGISRAKCVTPLRHAMALVSMKHPLGGEILALTNTYLAARFGGVVLTGELRREFEDRTRALRSEIHVGTESRSANKPTKEGKVLSLPPPKSPG